MSIYTLYLKVHNITGLRYLGQTKRNPIGYKGSGQDWKKHLQKYGNNVKTIILLQTSNKQELTETGRYYSKIWNIVNAVDDFGYKIYANRIPETGGGAGQKIGHIKNAIWRKKISNSLKNSPFSHRNNQRGKNNHMYLVTGKNHHRFGVRHSDQSRELISKNHCDFSGAKNPNARTIKIITNTGKIYISHGTLKDVCKELSLSISTIYNMLSRGKTNFTKGRFKGYQVYYAD